MTTPTKTQAQDIYITFRKILKRSQDIEAAYKTGGDMFVLQDLSAGEPAIVNHSFKWDGVELQRGQEFHPGMMFIGRIAEIMQQPNTSRILVSKQEWEHRLEWQRLQPIIEQLRPLVDQARDYKSQAAAARGAAEHAEQEARHWRGELDAAESNRTTTERKAAEYIAGLDLTGIEINI